MYPSLVLSAALIAPAAPVPRDTVPNTTSPAPRVLALKADSSGSVRVIGTIPVKQTVMNTYFVIENNVQVQKQIEQDIVTTQYFNKTLSEFNGKFATADGKALTLDEATSRVKNGATVLASADGKPISQGWLRSVASDTVVMTAEGLSHAQMQWGGAPYPTTPAPRLAMLAVDDKGVLQTQVTSAPINYNDGGVYYDEIQFEGRGMRGRGFKGGGYYGGPQPSNAKIVNKPLAEVSFEAFDLNGKRVHKSETLKRLAAGGMVLMAGDGRLPDETYLKGFHPDMIVLVSAELVLPVTPVDQTKPKKDPAKDPKADPMAPAVQPLPAVKPLIIRGGVAAPAVPAVEEKVKPEAKPVEKPAADPKPQPAPAKRIDVEKN